MKFMKEKIKIVRIAFPVGLLERRINFFDFGVEPVGNHKLSRVSKHLPSLLNKVSRTMQNNW